MSGVRGAHRTGEQAREQGRTRRGLGRAAIAMLAGGSGALAAACGAGGAGSSGQVAAPAAAPTGKLSFWGISADWGQMSQGVGGEHMTAFRAKAPQLELEISDVVPGGPASLEKIHTAAAADTLPDMYMANRGYATQLGAEGISRPLDDLLKRSRSLTRDDLWDAHIQDATLKGQLYAITHSSGVWVLYYNRELWQQGGLNPDQPPKTWEALEEAARRITTAGGGTPERVGYHPTFGGTGQRFWLVHYRQTGGDFFTKDWQPAFATDERAIRTLTWMKGLIDRQGGWPALEEFRKQASAGATGGIFGSGKLGAVAETHTQIAVLQRAASPVPFSVAPLPLPAGGKQSGWQGGGDLHISKKTKQVDAAWAVIEHLMAPANILQFSLTLSRIPSRKSVGLGKDYLDKSPHHKVFVEMAPHSHNVPAVPGNLELEPIIVKLSDDVMTGQKSIRDALQDAAQQTKVVVDKWRQYLT